MNAHRLTLLDFRALAAMAAAAGRRLDATPSAVVDSMEAESGRHAGQ